MPGMDGVEATRLIKNVSPCTPSKGTSALYLASSTLLTERRQPFMPGKRELFAASEA